MENFYDVTVLIRHSISRIDHFTEYHCSRSMTLNLRRMVGGNGHAFLEVIAAEQGRSSGVQIFEPGPYFNADRPVLSEIV